MARILVIENEPNIRKLVETNLAASGYQVILAEDGERGLESAKTQHPDMIFLDILMPGMSGWDVLATVKNTPNTSRIPIIMMSASVHAAQHKAEALGAAGFLPKPFTVEVLLKIIREILGEQEGNATNPGTGC